MDPFHPLWSQAFTSILLPLSKMEKWTGSMHGAFVCLLNIVLCTPLAMPLL